MKISPSFLIASFSIATVLGASLSIGSEKNDSTQELKFNLGERGAILFETKFDSDDAAKGWNSTVGSLKVESGVLKVSERSSDKHAAAFRRPIPLQDCAVQFDVKLTAETKLVHFGYDPSPGELKKKGHLFSVSISPTAWSIIEHGDKNDAKPKNIIHATASETFEPGKWYTILIECHGENVVAQVAGKKPLKAKSADFRVKKPGLVFRVGGPDDKPVFFDNLTVWELK